VSPRQTEPLPGCQERFELPLAAMAMATTRRYDAVVCLGAVIRGETSHFDFVAGQCAAGIQRVQLDMELPVVFGVLTTENLDQALARRGRRSREQGRRGGHKRDRDGKLASAARIGRGGIPSNSGAATADATGNAT